MFAESIDSGLKNPILIRRYCAALAGRARLDVRRREDWVEIIDLLGADEFKEGPEALTLLAEAYERTNKTSNAATISARLYAAGYRHPDFLALLLEFPTLSAAAKRSVSGPSAQ
jgi:hypothetical protein